MITFELHWNASFTVVLTTDANVENVLHRAKSWGVCVLYFSLKSANPFVLSMSVIALVLHAFLFEKLLQWVLTFPRCIYSRSSVATILFTRLLLPIICFISIFAYSLPQNTTDSEVKQRTHRAKKKSAANERKKNKLQLLSGKICWIFLYLSLNVLCDSVHWIAKRKSSALNRLFGEHGTKKGNVCHKNYNNRKDQAQLYCLHFPLLCDLFKSK